MQRRGNLFVIFFVLLIISIILIFLARNGQINGLTGFFEQFTVPIQRTTFHVFHSNISADVLKEENTKLLTQLAKQKEIEKENAALQDQFKTESIPSNTLIASHVIGLGSFIPGLTEVDEMTLDKGASEGVKKGQIVIYKDNLIGKVTNVSSQISTVTVLNNKSTSFTAETVKTSALGVIKSTGGDIVLDNVVLSDKLEKNDLVMTKGDIDGSGNGYPPHLVVGKISAIYKRNSDLFQVANIQSLVDVSKLEMVFVMTQQ